MATLKSEEDTRSVNLDEPISDGFAKPLLVAEKENVTHTEKENVTHTEKEDVTHTEKEGVTGFIPSDAVRLYFEYKHRHNEPPRLREWLAGAGSRLSQWVVGAATAAQIGLATLSRDDRWTASFDVAAITRMQYRPYSFRVSVSPELAMPRSEVFASSLLAPSGVYLTWLEMLEYESDDEG